MSAGLAVRPLLRLPVCRPSVVTASLLPPRSSSCGQVLLGILESLAALVQELTTCLRDPLCYRPPKSHRSTEPGEDALRGLLTPGSTSAVASVADLDTEHQAEVLGAGRGADERPNSAQLAEHGERLDHCLCLHCRCTACCCARCHAERPTRCPALLVGTSKVQRALCLLANPLSQPPYNMAEREPSFHTAVSLMRKTSPFHLIQQPTAALQQQQVEGLELKETGPNLLLGQVRGGGWAAAPGRYAGERLALAQPLPQQPACCAVCPLPTPCLGSSRDAPRLPAPAAVPHGRAAAAAGGTAPRHGAADAALAGAARCTVAPKEVLIAPFFALFQHAAPTACSLDPLALLAAALYN